MDCVSSKSDVKDLMDKFDYSKPIKVTIIEDSDSDGNIDKNAQLPESIPVQYPSPQHSSLKDLLISTPSIDKNFPSNVCSKSTENISNIGNERLNTHDGTYNSNVQNTHAETFHAIENLQSSSRETSTHIETYEASNSNYNDANGRLHYLNMLDTISEKLIALTKDYHYYNIKYKKDHRIKDEYMNQRNEHFNQIYHLSLSCLVPHENNKEFIRSFIDRTIEIARRKQWNMKIKSLEIIVGGLIVWTKQKKKYHESSNNEATQKTMSVQVPTSNNNYTRQATTWTPPVSAAPLSNSYLNTQNTPPFYSSHNVVLPTVPQGSLSTMVEATYKMAPITRPAYLIPSVQTNSRLNVPQRMNEAPLTNQSPISVVNSGINVLQNVSTEASLTAMHMYNSGFNVRQQMNLGPSVPSIPFSNNTCDIQQQNTGYFIPQVPTSNNGFNAQHQMNGTHPVSAIFNCRMNSKPHMIEAPSVPPISNSGFNKRHMNRENSVPSVPTSNSIFHTQQQMNGEPSIPPIPTSYNGFNLQQYNINGTSSSSCRRFNVQNQNLGASYIPPAPTSYSGYYVQHGINGTHSVSALPTSNDASHISPVATTNNRLHSHQRIKGQAASPIAKFNSSSNGSNKKERRPVISPKTKSNSAPYGTKSVKQRINSLPAISPTTNTKRTSYGINNVQQQINEVPTNGPEPVTNLLPPASSLYADLIGKTPTNDPNNTVCLFSTGVPGNEISIIVDRAFVKTVIVERVREATETPSNKRSADDDSKQPKKTFKSSLHPPCNDAQQIIQTNHSQTQLNIENGDNMNKVNCEMPFRARSISRDSGFGSPVLPAMTGDNITVYPNCANNQGLPEITYVTSVNPNASYNNIGLCKICGSVTKKKCIRCYKEYYCGATCQEIDWPHHMQECASK